MTEKMTCKVIQDLLPSYVDGLCSEESANLVKEHISTCDECRKVYDIMKQEEAAATSTSATVSPASSSSKTSSSRGAEISIDEKEIMKRINRKMHHNLMKNAIVGIVVGVLLLTLFVFAVRPNRSLSSSDYEVKYYNMNLKDLYVEQGGNTGTLKYEQIPQDCVVVYDPEVKDIDSCQFTILQVPGMTYARLAIDLTYLYTEPEICIITYSSNYYISEYDETVVTRDGKNYLSVKKVKTPLFGSKKSDGKVSVTTVQFCHIDGIDG